MYQLTVLAFFLIIFPYILLRLIGVKISIGQKCPCHSRLTLSVRIITLTLHHIFSHHDGDLEETWQDKRRIFLCAKCRSIQKQKYSDLVKIKMNHVEHCHEEEEK